MPSPQNRPSNNVRRYIKAPLRTLGEQAERDRRRNLYLTKVKRDGENRTWEARSNQILRSDFISRQKQWEAEQARSAPGISNAPDTETEEAQDGQTTASQSFLDVESDLLDSVISHETAELEALLSLMDYVHKDLSTETDNRHEPDLNDEDCDRLLLDMSTDAEYDTSPKGKASLLFESQEMDTSTGLS
ncbi:hypothetical protein MMC20_000713 [Loxospora ochrophaea]|nr:hypothetical protein [Loxospora ochrophaea]